MLVADSQLRFRPATYQICDLPLLQLCGLLRRLKPRLDCDFLCALVADLGSIRGPQH